MLTLGGGGVPIVFYTFNSRYGFRKPPYEKTDQNKRPKDTIHPYIVQTRVVHILWIKNPTDPGMAIVTYQTSLGYQVHILPVINLQYFLLKKKSIIHPYGLGPALLEEKILH